MLQTPRGTVPRNRKTFVRRAAAVLTVPLLLTSVAACGSSDGQAPKVESKAGDAGKSDGKPADGPKIAKGEGEPPEDLEVKVLKKGKGEKVKKGDALNAHYKGQLWNGKEFDSSYKRGMPSTFQIGTGKVIKGWDEALVGQNLGSRVQIVVPPDKGYGKEGQKPKIPGNSTLVFVVDLNKIMPSKIDGKPADEKPKDGLPEVSTKASKDEAPSIKMPGDAGEAPDELVKQTIVEGDGKEVKKDSTVLTNFTAKAWKGGKQLDNTWKQGGPTEIPVAQIPGWGKALKGVKEGSRVVFSVPEGEFPKQQQKQFAPGVVFSVDVLNVS